MGRHTYLCTHTNEHAHTGTRTWHSHTHSSDTRTHHPLHVTVTHSCLCTHRCEREHPRARVLSWGHTGHTHAHTHKHEKAHTHSPQGSPRTRGSQATPGCLCAVGPSQRCGICRTGLIPGAERSLLITSSAPGCRPCLAPTSRCLRPLHTHLSSMKSQGGHQEPLSH